MMEPPMGSPAHVNAGKPILLWALVGVLILAVALVGGGIWLVYAGATGATKMSIFGSHVETQSVGAVGLVSGLILGVVGIRGVLSTIVKLARIRD
jgi:hypothetical protein